MLAEGFLRVLLYREERKFASASKQHKTKTNTHCTDALICSHSNSNTTDLRLHSAEAGQGQEELHFTQDQGLRAVHRRPVGLTIPGCSPVLTVDPDITVCIDDCSLLQQYPDLQVADSGRISQYPLRATAIQHSLVRPVSDVHFQPEWEVSQQELRGEPVSSTSDQGYLVVGTSVNMSLGLPGSGLEPMSNSVLNGMLDKQVEEVYLQHMTDNLARCNSDLGNSLLHGLVPPPQPSMQTRGPDSLEACLVKVSGGGNAKKMSCLSTQNIPCSSNFSSPVLRISENDHTHLKRNYM
ncbi:hypothetical protein JOB18_035333 [Solea senegalensis]|uniref:Uncharacterized protein n=1 Tax=Solea senegalensis TaxID=28829 RepID=A0AAV6SPN4_SOLSE|nr:uncharacterized protein si:dkey-237j10.2 [Solea senegalensis]KAG7518476.1 hypothetical protein JOB18_035333 [Solea senegalensis]